MVTLQSAVRPLNHLGHGENGRYVSSWPPREWQGAEVADAGNRLATELDAAMFPTLRGSQPRCGGLSVA